MQFLFKREAAAFLGPILELDVALGIAIFALATKRAVPAPTVSHPGGGPVDAGTYRRVFLPIFPITRV